MISTKGLTRKFGELTAVDDCWADIWIIPTYVEFPSSAGAGAGRSKRGHFVFRGAPVPERGYID